jgi:acyl-coenzyme A thioesterase PaaI-like protein
VAKGGPRAGDGVVEYFGLRFVEPGDVRLTVRPDLLNSGGLLSGVATYALVDYGMGSTLWPQVSDDEGIATLNIAINYLQTAREGEVTCRTVLDRRNRSVGVLRSEVHAEDGRLLVTALGSYAIFPRDRLRRAT